MGAHLFRGMRNQTLFNIWLLCDSHPMGLVFSVLHIILYKWQLADSIFSDQKVNEVAQQLVCDSRRQNTRMIDRLVCRQWSFQGCQRKLDKRGRFRFPWSQSWIISSENLLNATWWIDLMVIYIHLLVAYLTC